jgi:hypothetical protein
VADDHHDLSDPGRSEVADAALGDSPPAERQQQLERAHPPRTPGGEDDGGDGEGPRAEGGRTKARRRLFIPHPRGPLFSVRH